MSRSVARMRSRTTAAIGKNIPRPLKSFVKDHKLGLAITGAIVIALVQTIISVGMYVNSSTYGLDLSRPEFERAKREVEPHAPQAVFNSTGPINPQVIDEFKKLYTDQAKPLKDSGKYDGTPLGDAELHFTPETSQSDPASDPSQ